MIRHKGEQLMLNTLTIQAAAVGFLFHWMISDGLYLQANPYTRYALYFLFIANLLGVAYTHITIARNDQLEQALQTMENKR
tara:strand:- start:391 stop:633 length:243 start_codon:yes stop_codon:yes gene_type:complete